MSLQFLGVNNIPTYTAVSSDVDSSKKITGANLPGKTVYLTDTAQWKFLYPDLTLGDYTNITGGGSGASVFTDLVDAPSSYSGQAGKSVRVNSGENGLEFVNTIADRPLAIVSSYYTESTILNLGTANLNLAWTLLDQNGLISVEPDNITLYVTQEGWYSINLRFAYKITTNPIAADGYFIAFIQNGGVFDNTTTKFFTKTGEDRSSFSDLYLSTSFYLHPKDETFDEWLKVVIQNDTGHTMKAYAGELKLEKISGPISVPGY